MLTESIGGVCPVCGYNKMLLRYGSQLYYKFDACPVCSFAFAHNDCDIVEKGQEVWMGILEVYGGELQRHGLPTDLNGLRQWIDEMDVERDECIKNTIWNYENHDLSDPAYFWLPMGVVNKIVAEEKERKLNNAKSIVEKCNQERLEEESKQHESKPICSGKGMECPICGEEMVEKESRLFYYCKNCDKLIMDEEE